MPYVDVPAFVADLRKREAMAARALEFTILTAARSGATWKEIDLEAELWTIPAGRMKAGREHRVLLTPRAVDILNELAGLALAPMPMRSQARGKVARCRSWQWT